MSELIQIETGVKRDPSRREVLRNIAMAMTTVGAGSLSALSAQHVHAEVQRSKEVNGTYERQFFTRHEFNTVRRLAELIVPADKQGPSAADAGAVEFIDLLCSQNERLALIYTGGVGWLDAHMRLEYATNFVSASQAQQISLLDQLVEVENTTKEKHYWGSAQYPDFHSYKTRKPSNLLPGVQFFSWVRSMSIDAYYTSAAGIKDIGYVGNDVLSDYRVPKEAIRFVMKKTELA